MSEYEQEKQKKQQEIRELRKEIAKQLYKGPKTEEDLKKELKDVNLNLLNETLKNMLTLKLIKKEGFPVKYSISQEIADKLNKRKEISENDKNIIRVSIIIESKSDNKSILSKSIESISEKLKQDPNYKVYDLETAEIKLDENDNLFSSYITAEVSCLDLQNLFKLVYFYGVTSIDVVKPEKLQVPISDLQQALYTIVDMTHGYADIIYKLQQKNKQLENLLGKKKN